MRRRLAHRADVVHLDAGGLLRRDALECLRGGLLGIADDEVGLVHFRESLGLDLRGAAGDDDLRLRTLAPHLANGLARLPHCLAGHGAGVDDDGVSETRLFGMPLRHFAFVSVQAAAKGDDIDAHPASASIATPAPFK